MIIDIDGGTKAVLARRTNSKVLASFNAETVRLFVGAAFYCAASPCFEKYASHV
jgi:hypothetical protein